MSAYQSRKEDRQAVSWTFYKILHLSSLFGAFLSLGGLWFFYAFIAGRSRGGPNLGGPDTKTSGKREGAADPAGSSALTNGKPASGKALEGAGGEAALTGAAAQASAGFQRGKTALLNCHGVFLFLAFTAGFGLTAKSGADWSFWLYIKLIVWLLLAAAPYFLKKFVLQKKKAGGPARALAFLAGLWALAALASAAGSLKWGAAPGPAPASAENPDKPQAGAS